RAGRLLNIAQLFEQNQGLFEGFERLIELIQVEMRSADLLPRGRDVRFVADRFGDAQVFAIGFERERMIAVERVNQSDALQRARHTLSRARLFFGREAAAVVVHRLRVIALRVVGVGDVVQRIPMLRLSPAGSYLLPASFVNRIAASSLPCSYSVFAILSRRPA